MARPVGIQKDAILKAARRIFLRYGYHAGTRQVARAAGISEGSLFKRFKTKNDLFLAAMDAETGGALAWAEELRESVGTGDLRATLQSVGLKILDHFQVILPRIIMVRSSGILVAGHARCSTGHTPRAVQEMHALADYFRAEIRQGRLVMPNPEVYAQVLLGTLTHYVIQEILFGFRAASPAVYVRTVVDMILQVTTPAHSRRRLARQQPRAMRVTGNQPVLRAARKDATP